MREIKFKAWDKNLKKMLNKKHGLQIEFYKNNGYGIWRNRLPGETGIWKSKRFSKEEIILLQYTGLKDKNGKEIYEGDILEYDDEFFKVEYHCDCFLACPFGISFEDDDFPRFPIGSLASHGNINYDCGYAKVIGNIYENPELIG